MGDVKKKSPTKNSKGKTKKAAGKSKNYIQENVKKLRQMQNERPKQHDDRRGLLDHPISYAERLNAVTSPHIKVIKKLSLLNEKSLQVINRKKKETMIKAKLKQISEMNTRSQPSLDIKIKKSPTPLTKPNEGIQKKETKSNTIIQARTPQKPTKKRIKRKLKSENDVPLDAVVNRNVTESGMSSENIDVSKEFTNENDEDDKKVEKLSQEGNYKSQSQVYYSMSQITKFSKGFKNESCQVKPSHSFESVNSKAVVRFPRRANKTTNQVNKNVCEKSFQTDVNNSKQASPVSKHRSRSPKKSPVLNKIVIPPTEGGKAEVQRSNLVNNQIKDSKFTKMFANLTSPAKDNTNKGATNKNKVKQKNNKNRLDAMDEKANVVLNNIISASNFDIKKLYNEIARVQKTSPFARHHTVFEKRSPEEIKKEHDSFMKNNPNRDLGAVLLPDHKRKEYLAQIKKRHSDLLRHLNTMPVNAKSSEARLQKLQLGKALESMDNAIKLFSKNHLLIDLNSTIN